jgi:betaine-aldehyde dehydrogenase
MSGAGTLRSTIELPSTGTFVDGTWNEATDGTRFDTIDPATERTITSVAAGGEADIHHAVAAARREFDGGKWSKLSATDRGRILIRLADLVERNIDQLAALESIEIGKPLFDATLEIGVAAETFRHFAGCADRAIGQTFDLPDFMGRPRMSYTIRQPIGVVGAITPWNAPTMIAAWKIAPAIAAGCTVVVKPAEDASLSTLRLAELSVEAGLPAGVLNVVPGLGIEAGAALVAHAGVDKVSFTGSPEVGRSIMRSAGPEFKRVVLELGGKSPQLVLPDADLELAIPGAAISLFANQGQTCAAGTRVLVHHSIVDEVVDGLAAQARNVRIGDPFEPGIQMGALVNREQMDRVLGYIDSGTTEGAELATGGGRVGDVGYFVEPTIFRGTNDLTIAREEIFGPVGTVVAFDDLDEAIALANDTVYGLAAVVWSQDLAAIHRCVRELSVGAVWVNAWGPPDPRLPWGGRKTSGIGQELGTAGLDACTVEKAVSFVL